MRGLQHWARKEIVNPTSLLGLNYLGTGEGSRIKESNEVRSLWEATARCAVGVQASSLKAPAQENLARRTSLTQHLSKTAGLPRKVCEILLESLTHAIWIRRHLMSPSVCSEELDVRYPDPEKPTKAL